MLRDLRFDLAFATPQLDGHITFSLDNKMVACHTDGELIVYQIIEDVSRITMKMIARIKTDVYKSFDEYKNLIRPFDLKFLPDNRHVVLHIKEGTFGVWDIISTKRIAMHTFNDAYSSGLDQFAVGSTDAGDLLLITHTDDAPFMILFRNAFTADTMRAIECKDASIERIVGTPIGRAIATFS